MTKKILQFIVGLTLCSTLSGQAIKELVLDFSKANGGDFQKQLDALHLKKGSFFSVRINNINPYRYNIIVTNKNDTIKSNAVPLLFNGFTDPSELAKLASNITEKLASVIFKENTNHFVSQIASKFEKRSVEEKTKINDEYIDSLRKANKDKQKRLDSNVQSYHKEQDYIQKVSPHSKSVDSLYNLIIDNQKNLASQVLSYQKEQNFKEKVNVYSKNIEPLYFLINDKQNLLDLNLKLYQRVQNFKQKTNTHFKSIDSIYNIISDKQNSLALEVLTYQKEQLGANNPNEKMEVVISQAQENVKKISALVNSIYVLNKKAVNDSTIKEKEAVELNALLEKYTSKSLQEMLNKIKSHSLMIENLTFLREYNSLPIQVTSDIMELKIDITPRSTTASKSNNSQSSTATATTNANSNTLNNQTPVNITINTADVKLPETKSASPEKKEEEKVITLPEPIREYHLKYKFRTNTIFYGFSSGFFMDWLKDDKYTSKPLDPLNSNTNYSLIKENNGNDNKFGTFAAVNIGRYFGKKNAFIQFFAGPGLSIESKLQPRLLFGFGIGKGDANKFSVNAGFVIGQVKKLSNSFDLNNQYNTSQTNIYYTTNEIKPFIAVSYIFDLVRK